MMFEQKWEYFLVMESWLLYLDGLSDLSEIKETQKLTIHKRPANLNHLIQAFSYYLLCESKVKRTQIFIHMIWTYPL